MQLEGPYGGQPLARLGDAVSPAQYAQRAPRR